MSNTPIRSKLACKLCPSSDAVTLYENPENKSRFYKCYSCGKAYRVKGTKVDTLTEAINKDNEQQDSLTENLDGEYFKEKYRALTPQTLKFYRVFKELNSDNVVFPYGDYEGNILAYKCKTPQKLFNIKHKVTKGFQQSGLFGAGLFPSGGKIVTVTEGEEDAMSVYQMQGSKYATYSLKNGGNSVLTQEDKKHLDSFETIVFCGDSDAPGLKAAEKFSSLFGKNKVKIVKLTKFKDANDYLQKIDEWAKAGHAKEATQLSETFLSEWWKAQPYTPEGLVQGKATLDMFLNEKEAESHPYPWQGLQNLLHGIRTSELVVITAGSGSGKSAVMRELAYHIFKTVPDTRIGCMFLEESVKRTVKDLVGLELSMNLRLPENVLSQDQKAAAWSNMFDNERWIFWDHFGSNDIETVCNQVRFVANNFGAKYIFLDHVSIIVSDGSHGDERKALDAIMTRLRTLVQELDIALFLVSHLRRSNDSTPHEEGGVTSLSQLRGSAGIGQLADVVIGLERNGQADNPIERNLTTLRILKNRYTGETGVASYLLWDKNTGRLKEVENKYVVEEMIKKAEMEARGEINADI